MSADDHAWWDDLPDRSVVLYLDMPLTKYAGQWYFGDDELVNTTGKTPDLVIHVPVTDAEPPVGSIVETSEGLTIRDDDGWRLYGEYWAPMEWDAVKPNVTRILRWGE